MQKLKAPKAHAIQPSENKGDFRPTEESNRKSLFGKAAIDDIEEI
jgi:hypothetical protein